MTMTIQMIGTTDHSADDEDTEPDNNTCKRQRKVYAPADTNRKELTKQRQAQILKKSTRKRKSNSTGIRR